MAGRYLISSQLLLLPPSAANLQQVQRSILLALTGGRHSGVFQQKVKIDVDLQQIIAAHKAIQQLNQSFNVTPKLVSKTTSAVGGLNSVLNRMFLRFTIFYGLLNSFRKGAEDAYEFANGMIKVGQVTGLAGDQLERLQKQILQLGIKSGTNLTQLTDSFRELVSGGIPQPESKGILDKLSKAGQIPGFDNLVDTSKGLVAAFQSFNLTGKETADILDHIALVSTKYGVDAGDLTAIISKTAGSFADAGGNIKELIALFASVRGATKESAEGVATGLKTIIARLQDARVQTHLFIKAGIQLRNSEGEFVGPLKALEQISAVFKRISPRSQLASNIANELGIRQVNRFLPLIKDLDKAQQILNEENKDGNLVEDLAAKRAETLINKFARLKNEVVGFFSSLGNNEALKTMADLFITLAHNATQFAGALANIANKIPPWLLVGGGVLGAGALGLSAFGPKALLGKKGKIGGVGGFALRAGLGILSGAAIRSQFGGSEQNQSLDINGVSAGGSDLEGNLVDAGIEAFFARQLIKGINIDKIIRRKKFQLVRGSRDLANKVGFGNLVASGAASTGAGLLNILPKKGIGTALSIGTAGALIGNAFSESGSTDIKAGRFETGQNASIAGGVITGAATGGAVGALIGSVIPVIGTTIGAAVGAVAGGLTGLVIALKESSEQIKEVTKAHAFADLQIQVDNLNKGLTEANPKNVHKILFGLNEATGDENTPQSRKIRIAVLDPLLSAITKRSNSVKSFQTNRGDEVLHDVALARGLNPKDEDELRNKIHTELQIRENLNQGLNGAVQTIDDFAKAFQAGQIADSINLSLHKEINAKSGTGNFNFSSLDLSHLLGTEASSIKTAEKSLGDIVEAFGEGGKEGIKNATTLTNKLLPNAKETAAFINEAIVTNEHSNKELLGKSLKDAIANRVELTKTANTGVGTVLSNQAHIAGISRQAELAADLARVNTGEQSVSQTIFGREFSPQQLGNSIRANGSALAGVNTRLATGQFNGIPELQQLGNKRNELITAIEKEKQALDLMANSTSRVTKLQNEIEFERRNKQGELNVAQVETFGSFSEKIQLARQKQLAQGVLGGNLGGLSDEDKKGVLNFFQSFGNSPLTSIGRADLTGNQAIGQLIQKTTGNDTALTIANKEKEILSLETQRVTVVGQLVLKEKALIATLDELLAKRGPNGGKNVQFQGNNIIDNLKQLDTTLANLKDLDIKHTFNGQVEVIINGAAVFAQLQPQVQNLINKEVGAAMQRFIDQKFPKLGKVGGR